jgi:hypothetical protein
MRSFVHQKAAQVRCHSDSLQQRKPGFRLNEPEANAPNARIEPLANKQ